ncbi:MAG: aminopeptidase P family protein [Granulosicoccus sp.]|nr:aminopeptidase P family protein [Granulosicoccus sp.]
MTQPRLVDYTGNGERAQPTFTLGEMQRRQNALRHLLSEHDLQAAVFTSYHNICYFSDFMYCRFGRRYALVVDHDQLTSVSAGIDGGQPWRRTVGHNITYTDWQHDNYFHALKGLLGQAQRIGIEFDHVDLQLRQLFAEQFPDVEFVDISTPVMHLRMIKSDEEIAHIAAMAQVADIGGAACVDAIELGASEYEIALSSTQAMVREIARVWPHAELMDTWTWIQSGINTDGAHNPVTSRRIQRGDILSLNCFPMVAGYYVALERTLFAGEVDDASRRLWEINCEVHNRGKELLVVGAKCSDIAKELNDLYASYDLLQYRSFGYGHSFGVLCHYYGREADLELREDCETVLEPGMVVSMEPMITLPEGTAGAGGYREHDILVIEDKANRARNLTGFAYGPDHLIVDI